MQESAFYESNLVQIIGTKISAWLPLILACLVKQSLSQLFQSWEKRGVALMLSESTKDSFLLTLSNFQSFAQTNQKLLSFPPSREPFIDNHSQISSSWFHSAKVLWSWLLFVSFANLVLPSLSGQQTRTAILLLAVLKCTCPYVDNVTREKVSSKQPFSEVIPPISAPLSKPHKEKTQNLLTALKQNNYLQRAKLRFETILKAVNSNLHLKLAQLKMSILVFFYAKQLLDTFVGSPRQRSRRSIYTQSGPHSFGKRPYPFIFEHIFGCLHNVSVFDRFNIKLAILLLFNFAALISMLEEIRHTLASWLDFLSLESCFDHVQWVSQQPCHSSGHTSAPEVPGQRRLSVPWFDPCF